MILRALIFLIGFAIVLLLVTHLYLIPALIASEQATPKEKAQLAATARLVLMVVLFVLFAGLVLTFRVGRFFFPRPPAGKNKPTEYVDAWAEAGRRATVEDDDSREGQKGGD